MWRLSSINFQMSSMMDQSMSNKRSLMTDLEVSFAQKVIQFSFPDLRTHVDIPISFRCVNLQRNRSTVA